MTYFAGSGKGDPVKFVYMNIKKGSRIEDGGGEFFNPYNLEVVPKKDANPEHYIFSVTGVVHVTPSLRTRLRLIH